MSESAYFEYALVLPEEASRIDFTSEDVYFLRRFNPDLHRIPLNPYNGDSDEITDHNALVYSPA